MNELQQSGLVKVVLPKIIHATIKAEEALREAQENYDKAYSNAKMQVTIHKWWIFSRRSTALKDMLNSWHFYEKLHEGYPDIFTLKNLEVYNNGDRHKSDLKILAAMINITQEDHIYLSGQQARWVSYWMNWED